MGETADRLDIRGLGNFAGRRDNPIRDRAAHVLTGCFDHLTIGRIAFDLFRDGIHGLHGLNGILARRTFGRQHDGIGALINGGGHIGHLGPGGHRAFDHALQHLGRNDHRFRHRAAPADQAFLNRRHVLHRQFHPQIAARHHDPIGHGQDIFERFHSGGFFDLGQDRGPAIGQGAGLFHIFGPLNKAERQPVDPKRTNKFQILAVFFAERGKGQNHIGHIHPLAVGYGATGNDLTIGEIRAAIRHPQPDFPVIDQQLCAGFQHLKNLGVGQAHAGGIALGLIQIKPERRAFDQFLFAIGKGADTQLRALKIRQNTDCRIQLTLDLADDLVTLADLIMAAMAHIQAEHICPGLVQLTDHRVIRRSRAKGRDDFGVAQASHTVHPL